MWEKLLTSEDYFPRRGDVAPAEGLHKCDRGRIELIRVRQGRLRDNVIPAESVRFLTQPQAFAGPARGARAPGRDTRAH